MKSIKVYFAGKVSKDCYRTKIWGNDRIMSSGNTKKQFGEFWIEYGGPNAIGCDHGCFHAEASHGLIAPVKPKTMMFEGREVECYGCDEGFIDSSYRTLKQFSKPFAQLRCLAQIKEADLFYAYIDSLDCYGTLCEIGYAHALKKTIWIDVHESLDARELWFVLQAASKTRTVKHADFAGFIEFNGLFFLGVPK